MSPRDSVGRAAPGVMPSPQELMTAASTMGVDLDEATGDRLLVFLQLLQGLI